MQGIFQKENTDKALKYGIYRHLPTYEKIIRNLVSFYNKKLQKVVLDELYKIAIGEKYYKKTSKLLSDIENYLYELEWEMDYNLDISFEDFRDILKTGVKNILEPEEVVERILVYIKLAARLMKTKCLIFIGSQKYFTEAEWKMFENAAICEEIYLFCIGNEEVFASHKIGRAHV